MPGMRLTAFGGMKPIVSPRLLEQHFAQIAVNTWLINGELRPLPQLDVHGSFGGDIKAVLSVKDQKNITVFLPAGLPNATDFSEVRSMLHRDGPDYLYVTGAEGGWRVREAYATDQQTPVYATHDFGFNDTLVAPDVVQADPGDAESNFCNVSYCYTVVDQYGRESAGSIAKVYQESVNVDSQFTVTIPALANPTEMGTVSANIYRTVTPFQTGDAPDNPIDTRFHLIKDNLPFDGTAPIGWTDTLLFSARDGSLLTNITATKFPRTDRIAVSPDGWLAVQSDEYIYISKRHQYHILPLEHVVSVPGVIVAMGWRDSDLYVATQGRPARISMEGVGELARVNVDVYEESLPCSDKESFTITSFGAMYASTDGLASLMPQGAFISTHNLIAPFQWRSDFRPERGVWYHGSYIGYSNKRGDGFIYDFADTPNGKHALSEVVKFELDFEVDYMGVTDDVAIMFFASGSQLYAWDFLTIDATPAGSLPYRWVSKTFVMPGTTQLGAAKIAMVVPGAAEFILYGDERIVYQRAVSGTTTFRLPSNYKAKEFVIEILGTAFIHEVHVATSMQDLTE